MSYFLIWAVTNIAIIVCFTALAMFFGKWWIVLFAALFTYGWKSREKEDTAHEDQGRGDQ
ncbi:MAG: hypothetical protein J6Q14_03735 [Oscillospiraceae bacterium]|nr:hypothetical protein [Oscillospiraceae bacterium]